LRIDRGFSGALVGRMKIYVTVNQEAGGEDLEFDLSGVQFDGTTLSFSRTLVNQHTQAYTGTISGRAISGTFRDNGSAPAPWSGNRAEVLSYGIGGGWSLSSSTGRLNTLRQQLFTLMMAGNPPAALSSTTTSSLPVLPGAIAGNRDDDAPNHPQNYTLREYTNTYSLTNTFDGSPTSRTIHGFMARPTTSPPPGGYRIAIAVNGHGGSAWQTMSPSSWYWQGDGFARRGTWSWRSIFRTGQPAILLFTALQPATTPLMATIPTHRSRIQPGAPVGKRMVSGPGMLCGRSTSLGLNPT
jgi:hypothetical protein